MTALPIPEVVDVPALCNELRELHARRRTLIRSTTSLTNQIKAVCRRVVAVEGKDDTAGLKRADRIYAEAVALCKGKPVDASAFSELAPVVAQWIAPLHQARTLVETEVKTLKKQMEKIAAHLPVAGWVKSVAGFGLGNLACVVGETGDMSGYSNPAKVWKRLGLAVIRGERQRRTTDKDLAIEMGYSPSRRAIVFVLGECLIKAQGKDEKAGPYRRIYDQRKAYELERDPEMSAQHVHRRAKRYMEKRVIRDLWRAWRDAR